MSPRFDIVINHRRRLNFVRLKELGYASCDPFPILPHFDAIYELLGTFKASTLIETRRRTAPREHWFENVVHGGKIAEKTHGNMESTCKLLNGEAGTKRYKRI